MKVVIKIFTLLRKIAYGAAEETESAQSAKLGIEIRRPLETITLPRVKGLQVFKFGVGHKMSEQKFGQLIDFPFLVRNFAA